MFDFHNALPQMPDTARIWMFGAHRKMTVQEVQSLSAEMATFVSGWQAHGKDLAADFVILWDAVLVVAVDESKEPPSGCSIDKVFQLLKLQQEKNQLDFFQRTLIWSVIHNDLRIDTPETVALALQSGDVDFNTPVINMLSPHLGDLRSQGLVALSQSWIAKKLQRELNIS